MRRQQLKGLTKHLARTSIAGLAAGTSTVSQCGSHLRRQGSRARDRFESLPSPWQAALRSCLLGGAGQIHLGQRKKGVLIICIAVLGLCAFVIPGIIVTGLGVYDAYVVGRRFQCYGKIGAWECFWHKPVVASWQVVRVEPIGITEEPLGIETLRIDNQRGRRVVKRSIRIQKEWSQSYVIEHEKAQTTTSQFEPTVTKSTLIKRTVENLCREKYSYSESKKQIIEEHVTVTVPPHSSLCVELCWKNILDSWLLVIANDLGDQVKVPVHVVTKLSFDQRILNADAVAS